eukprot:4722397-Alexandrium_andersonii.AAC.1
MSASLVGSEMCIRDRSLPDRSPLVADSRRSLMCGLWVGGAGETSASAVSYTHLTLPTICSV